MSLALLDRTRHQARTRRLKARLSRIVRLGLLAVLAALFLRSCVYAPYAIPSRSMQPTLERGDYIFVAKWPYGYGRHALPLPSALPISLLPRFFAHLPDRGDMIVFKSPRDNRSDLVKRVIGLPGDVIAMRGGQLSLNGTPVPRRGAGSAAHYIETLPGGRDIRIIDSAAPADFGPAIVPENHLFLLGDHRSASADSRWTLAQNGLGMVPFGHVIGRADMIIMSLGADGLHPDRIGTKL